ncbi:MAG: hypothetical protein CL878_05715 [Dehalococcoidia bacterium]|nr:hypothetical protein [Dehalococcoidia bacterium]
MAALLRTSFGSRRSSLARLRLSRQWSYLQRWLLRWELAYSLPAIALLSLNPDQGLVSAWDLERIPGIPWKYAQTDTSPLTLWLLALLPVIPWIIRYLGPGKGALVSLHDYSILIYVSGALVGLVLTWSVSGATTRVLGILAALYLYYLIWHTASTPRRLYKWLLGVLGWSAAMALLTLSLLGFSLASSPSADLVGTTLSALSDFALGPLFHLYFFDVTQRVVSNPNGLADFALVVALISGVIALDRAPRWRQLAWLLPCLAATWLLLATGSRTAILAGVLSIAYILWRTSQRWLLAIVPVLMITAGVALIPSQKRTDLLNLWSSTAGVARLQVWSSYWGLARESPMVGHGLGLRSVATAYSRRYGLTLKFTDPHAHNVLLQTLLEQGVLGLAGMLLVVWTCWRSAEAMRANAHSDSDSRPATVALASWAAMLGLLFHALFDIALNSNVGLVLFFALAALAARAGSYYHTATGGVASGELRSDSPGHITLRQAIGATLGVSFLVAVLSFWPPPLAPHVYVR